MRNTTVPYPDNIVAFIRACNNKYKEHRRGDELRLLASIFELLLNFKDFAEEVDALTIRYEDGFEIVFTDIPSRTEKKEEEVSRVKESAEDRAVKVEVSAKDPEEEAPLDDVEPCRPPTSEIPDQQDPLPGSESTFLLNMENLFLLDAPLKLYHQLTGKTMRVPELVTALTTLDFTKICASFSSKNKFFVWLNMVLKTGIVISEQLWTKALFPEVKDRRNFNGCVRKCKNPDVEMCRCQIEEGLKSVSCC